MTLPVELIDGISGLETGGHPMDVIRTLGAFVTGVAVAATVAPPAPAALTPPSAARVGAPAAVAGPVTTPERERSGTMRWRLSRPASNGQIEGFTDRASAPAGSRVRLKVSTQARRFRVEAYRFGWYRGGTARLVWRSASAPGRRQPEATFSDRERRTVVAPWATSLRLPTAGWPAGVYVLKLVASDGWQAHVPYVVRSTSARGRLALVAPVTTWQAYNRWGGYSLYHGPPDGDRRAWAVSFDRPYPGPGATDLVLGVRPVVVRAERLGLALAYYTNLDLVTVPGALRGATGYVSMGHDEYWTPYMRQVVQRARDGGTNLAFLGANTMYWRIRLEAGRSGPARVVVGYRQDAVLDPVREVNPSLTTARFKDPPAANPENSLVGVRYECSGVDEPYVVAAPRWWGFRGTGVVRGSSFPHLVGTEVDRVYPVPATPRPLQVLSHVPFDCRGRATSAQSVYYTVGSGAGVFTAGTLSWTCSLDGRCPPFALTARTVRFTRTVTDNLLREFARPRAGRRHPARDNVDRFDLPTVRLPPAS